ncbi:hypothetical protein HDK64DRAFT_252122 [Phyllosticta capitalensis]
MSKHIERTTSAHEGNWAYFLEEDERHGVPDPPFAEPDGRTERLWAERRRNGGFKQNEFPPINIELSDGRCWVRSVEALPAALQLFFVAAPDKLRALASKKGGGWDFDEKHRAVKLISGGNHIPDCDDSLYLAWTVLATGSLFEGDVGVLLHHVDDECRPEPVVVAETECNLFEALEDDGLYDWQDFFRRCMGPKDINIAGNRTLQSIQTYVDPEDLPAYFSVFLNRYAGQDESCRLFPSGDFVVYFKKENNSIAAARMRWVGGIYSKMDHSYDQVVFDWGDDASGVGYSETGNWATDPPKRYARDELEKKMEGKLRIGLMLFRRV